MEPTTEGSDGSWVDCMAVLNDTPAPPSAADGADSAAQSPRDAAAAPPHAPAPLQAPTEAPTEAHKENQGRKGRLVHLLACLCVAALIVAAAALAAARGGHDERRRGWWDYVRGTTSPATPTCTPCMPCASFPQPVPLSGPPFRPGVLEDVFKAGALPCCHPAAPSLDIIYCSVSAPPSTRSCFPFPCCRWRHRRRMAAMVAPGPQRPVRGRQHHRVRCAVRARHALGRVLRRGDGQPACPRSSPTTLPRCTRSCSPRQRGQTSLGR